MLKRFLRCKTSENFSIAQKKRNDIGNTLLNNKKNVSQLLQKRDCLRDSKKIKQSMDADLPPVIFTRLGSVLMTIA